MLASLSLQKIRDVDCLSFFILVGENGGVVIRMKEADGDVDVDGNVDG
jgi:hypothetical protein